MSPWFHAAAGGAVFGLGSGLLVLGSGRVAGVGGIAAGLVGAERSERSWRAAVLAGMIGGAALAAMLLPEAIDRDYAPALTRLLPGALLVGAGTRIGNGCTSGHGVCGVGRFSLRSIIAVCMFCLAGGITEWAVGR